jgi:hypothetical protein
MKKSKRSEPDQVPLDGEILPPAHVSAVTVAEMSPTEFLALHGVKPPRPKAHRGLRAAMRAIITEVAEAKP